MQVAPAWHAVGALHARQPPSVSPVHVTSSPALHSVAPVSHASEHEGDAQTSPVQLCPVGHAAAVDQVLHGTLPKWPHTSICAPLQRLAPVVHASVQVAWQVPCAQLSPGAHAVVAWRTVQPLLATTHCCGTSPAHEEPRPFPR